MVAPLGNAALMQQKDLVHALEAADPVGYQQQAAPLGPPQDLLHHGLFGVGIESLGGFVEDQDRRLLEQGAGDGQTAYLAAGEP
jgi:hypothetical protein